MPLAQINARSSYATAPVVFRGQVVAVEDARGLDEVLTIAVEAYYKGSGESLVTVTNLLLFRQCHSAFKTARLAPRTSIT